MNRRLQRKPMRRAARGATLIEILVSMVILMLGLLGLIGMMVQSQRAQVESYQRVQALLLVQDMVARINANRVGADCYYLNTTTLGTGSAVVTATPGCTLATTDPKQQRALADLNDWRNLLLGSAEVSGGNNVGAILGARGCITRDASGTFQVSVVWQGVQAVGTPPAGITCGAGLYGDEAQRRAVSVTLLPPTAS